VGHAADSYHRIDIRQASRNLVVHHHDRVIADYQAAIVLYEFRLCAALGTFCAPTSMSPR